MREREIWDARINPVYYAAVSFHEFLIKATLNRDGRDIRVSLTADQKQTARWLAKSLLEWAGEEEES